MKFLLIFSIGVGVVNYVNCNAISAGDAHENLCPPPENIAPITCFKDPISDRVTALCTNFNSSNDIKDIFDRNPGWNLQDVWINRCVLQFLPAKILEDARFQTLNVSSTTLYTLFDRTPKTTPEINVYLHDVKIQRGFEWSNLAHANLLELGFFNMPVRYLGQDFKDNIPKGVQRLWFENTEITSIRNQAFSQLLKLELLVVRGGSMKKVSRDMFPKPWPVNFLDLSYQKIPALPEDFFTDLPNLSFFLFEGNLLSTISEKVFTIHRAFYAFRGNPIECDCNIKWITKKLGTMLLEGTCSAPASLKGKELKSLRENMFGYCH